MMKNMKKEILKRLFLGIPFGIAIGCGITLFISAGVGDGEYYPCVPALITSVGTPLQAVVLQTVLCGALGAVSCAGSVIFSLDGWSILKQSGVYFLILSAAMMPTAYVLYWMEHSLSGAVGYFAVFVLVFLFVWLSQYIGWKVKLKKMNEKLK